MQPQESSPLRQRFTKMFGAEPRIFTAPGRVNLIGEHTDYNDGFVLPAAIQFSTRAAVALNIRPRIVAYSTNFDERVEMPVDRLPSAGRGHWSDYVLGIAVMLAREGHRIGGADVWIEGAVPLGSGLSSSAAVEVATAFALTKSWGIELAPRELAKLCQRTENEFVGARVGIMDQLTSCLGREGRALLIDCRSLEIREVPLPSGAAMVVCNTMVRHSLASGEYNERRNECERAVRILARAAPEVRSLRDVRVEQLNACEPELGPVLFKRAKHVVTENQRVLSAARALIAGEIQRFGKLMFESHESLRDDYQVSCAELDASVEIASKLRGVFGVRMMGGGFGGCVIALVEADQAGNFERTFREQYESRIGITPEIYVCTATDGAHEEIA